MNNEEAPMRGRPIEEVPPPESLEKRAHKDVPYPLTAKIVIRLDNVRCEVVAGPKWKNGATGVYQLCLRAIGVRDHEYWATCDELGLPRVRLMTTKKRAVA